MLKSEINSSVALTHWFLYQGDNNFAKHNYDFANQNYWILFDKILLTEFYQLYLPNFIFMKSTVFCSKSFNFK